jgi:hypothetical protein
MKRPCRDHRGELDTPLQRSVPGQGRRYVDRTGSVLTHPWAWMVLAAQAAVLIAAGPRILALIVHRMLQGAGGPRPSGPAK